MIRVLRHLSRCIPARNSWSRLSVSYHFLLYIACLVKWCAILLYVHRRHGEELLSLRAAEASTPAAALWYLVYFSNQHTKHRGMKMGVGSSRWDLRSFIQTIQNFKQIGLLGALGRWWPLTFWPLLLWEHPGGTSRRLYDSESKRSKCWEGLVFSQVRTSKSVQDAFGVTMPLYVTWRAITWTDSIHQKPEAASLMNVLELYPPILKLPSAS